MTASAPDPRKIVDLEAHITLLANNIELKHRQIEAAQRKRITRQPLKIPLWRLREQLADMVEQFDLAIAELESRHM